MSNWLLEKTEIFDKKFQKLIPQNIHEIVKDQIRKLSENPYNSKPLGYRYFREKKIQKWRIYFLLYNKRMIVYFIDISNKKLQQETIDAIKKSFTKHKENIEKKYKD